MHQMRIIENVSILLPMKQLYLLIRIKYSISLKIALSVLQLIHAPKLLEGSICTEMHITFVHLLQELDLTLYKEQLFCKRGTLYLAIIIPDLRSSIALH